MNPKHLEKNSLYAAADQDQDGTVSDKELESFAKLEELREKQEKLDTQKNMAIARMGIMVVMTGLLFFVVAESRLKQISDLIGLAYIAFSGISCAYMGMSAYMSHKR